MAYPPVLSTSSISGKNSFAVTAKGKIFADADNNLVSEGDESAAILVAIPGETLSHASVQKYPNYRDHFEPVNKQDAFPPADDAEEKEVQEAALPVAKRGKKVPVVNPTA